MRLYFQGSELPTYRNHIVDNGVDSSSLSYLGLRKRTKFTKPWLIKDKFPEGHHLFVDSGCSVLNNAKEAKYSNDELSEIADHYYRWIDQNIQHIEIYSEFDATQLGRGYIGGRRDSVRDVMFDKFLPIWREDDGMDGLTELADRFGRVGIAQTTLKGRDLVPHLNRLASRGVELHGLAMTKPDIMQAINWTSVSSTSWTTPQRYGDTIIWSHGQLKRYPKSMKDQARKKERYVLQSNGFDVDKIYADDPKELLRLSLWSWQQLMNKINKNDTGVTTYPPIRSDLELEVIEINYEAEKIISDAYREQQSKYVRPKQLDIEVSDQIELNPQKELTDQAREKIRQRNREVYTANKEYRLAQKRAYYLQWSPEQKAKASQYRALRRVRVTAQMSEEDKEISRGYRQSLEDIPCHYCGLLKDKMHIDHFFPLAKGGTDHWYNLVPACSDCNLSKGTTCGTMFTMKTTQVTRYDETHDTDNSEFDYEDVGTVVEKRANRVPTANPRDPAQKRVIPLIDFDIATTQVKNKETGEFEDVDIPKVKIRSESMRICDTCFLAAKCPMFEENSTCAYDIPIQVETRDQLQSLMNTLVSMQTQRVLFMKMAEDAEGGMADPILSGEIDRLGKLIEKKHTIEQEGFSLTITAKQSGEASRLDRLFGDMTNHNFAALPAPVPAQAAIEQLGIIDAEIVDLPQPEWTQ